MRRNLLELIAWLLVLHALSETVRSMMERAQEEIQEIAEQSFLTGYAQGMRDGMVDSLREQAKRPD